jgi:hypothetical protein
LNLSGHGTAYLSIAHINDYVADDLLVHVGGLTGARYQFEASPIPEPFTWLLLLTGLLVVASLRFPTSYKTGSWLR